MENIKSTLVVGASRGLGLKLAELFQQEGREVYVTGRRSFKREGLHYIIADLSEDRDLPMVLDALVDQLPRIDTLVYAAGFSQPGTLTDLDDHALMVMDNVGLRAPVMLVRRIVEKQHELESLIVITSSSQYKPRPNEHMYAATKAGLAHWAASISEDGRIDKTLVVAPAGMDTEFWEGSGKDVSGYLDPGWVAKEIFDLSRMEYTYCYVRIDRSPESTIDIHDIR